MAFLISCWFIIETVVIPDGFLKWVCLSLYIHPFFLFGCQIFLSLKFLKEWVLVIASCPLRIIFQVGSCVFEFFRTFVVHLFSFFRLSSYEVIEETEYFEVEENFNQNQSVISLSYLSIAPIAREIILIELRKVGFGKDIDGEGKDGDAVLHANETVEAPNLCVDEDTSTNEFLSSVCSSNSFTTDEDSNHRYPSSVCSSNSLAEDLDMNEYVLSDYSSNLVPIINREDREESDSFYKKYTERMRWFDMLNSDRASGISAVLNNKLGTPSLFESIEPADFSTPFVNISWDKMLRKRLLRSLESDFEKVYVAQSCLSWEALHHQYRKVETVASSTSQNGVFYNNVAGEFQKFQVLLERFMEDERCEGKRYWNYVQGRFSLRSLLQVPEVSGFLEEENEGMEGEAVSANEVLKAIEKCIKAFWVFVKTDKKKSWWKFSSLWTYPPVEDPRDLELLALLTKRLQKNQIWFKDLEGKRRCWLKRVAASTLEESQKKEILFTMIDMKLVARVLQTSVVSSSQLKWCQDKLDNIEFKEGKVVRATNSILFPP